MEREQGEEYNRPEIDPKTGVVEKVDKEKKAGGLSQQPEDWREKQ